MKQVHEAMAEADGWKAKTLDVASWFTQGPFAVPGAPAGAPGQPIVVEPPIAPIVPVLVPSPRPG